MFFLLGICRLKLEHSVTVKKGLKLLFGGFSKKALQNLGIAGDMSHDCCHIPLS